MARINAEPLCELPVRELPLAVLARARDVEDESADKVVLTLVAHPPADED